MMDYLYKKGKENKRDYLKEFLEKDFTSLKQNKAHIYAKPDSVGKAYLIKNDIVDVLSLKNNLVKMIYITAKRKKITGWLPVESLHINPKIIVKKSKIYTSPDVLTKMYLIKNDRIEIIEIVNDWVKMKYITAKGREIIGWLKRNEVSIGG